jgi:hypothetical protein
MNASFLNFLSACAADMAEPLHWCICNAHALVNVHFLIV